MYTPPAAVCLLHVFVCLRPFCPKSTANVLHVVVHRRFVAGHAPCLCVTSRVVLNVYVIPPQTVVPLQYGNCQLPVIVGFVPFA